MFEILPRPKQKYVCVCVLVDGFTPRKNAFNVWTSCRKFRSTFFELFTNIFLFRLWYYYFSLLSLNGRWCGVSILAVSYLIFLCYSQFAWSFELNSMWHHTGHARWRRRRRRFSHTLDVILSCRNVKYSRYWYEHHTHSTFRID